MLYCPNKTKKKKQIFFLLTVRHFLPLGFCCTVPIKPILLADALGRLKKIFLFYWDSTALFTKKIGFIGTVPQGF